MEAVYTYKFPSVMPASLPTIILSNVMKCSLRTMEIVKLWKEGVLFRDAMNDLLLTIEGIFTDHMKYVVNLISG